MFKKLALAALLTSCATTPPAPKECSVLVDGWMKASTAEGYQLVDVRGIPNGQVALTQKDQTHYRFMIFARPGTFQFTLVQGDVLKESGTCTGKGLTAEYWYVDATTI